MNYNELYHHGILGQKWGVQNGPPYPLSRDVSTGSSLKSNNKKKTKEYSKQFKSGNVGSFGKSKDNNILYITGISGSGKSTLARSYHNKNTNIIHLDLYLEKENSKSNDRDKEFDNYLKKNGFNTDKLYDLNPKERYKNIDKFAEKLLQDFSKEQYIKGKRVVVEGVQLSDDTMFPDKSFFKDKSVIVLKNSALKSIWNASIRDGEKLDTKKIYRKLKISRYWNKRLDELINIMEASK